MTTTAPTPAEKPVRILKLQTANVLRLNVVEIEPDGSLVVIGGKNGQGKSSVLKSIEMALGGKESIPPEPVRKGQRRAKTVITLDNGISVTREYAANGTRLKVTDAAGLEMKSPQTVLDKLVGALSFDPLEYMRKKPTEQGVLLRKLAGIDTTALDQQREKLYQERTEKGRDLTKEQARLEAAEQHPDAPAEPVDVSALTDELTELQKQASANAQQLAIAQRNAEAGERSVRESEDALRHVDNEIVRLRAELDAAVEKSAANVEALATMRRASAEARAKFDAARAVVDPDPAPVRQRLKEAETVNAKVRANRARAELAKSVEKGEAERERLTLAIEKIDFEKLDMLKNANLPIDGLAFDGDLVTFRGVPLSQASQAEQLRVSVAMGIAMNPRLRVLLVRDGALLDEDSLKLLAEMAEAANAQVWLERVSTGDECHVIIEDGNVRNTAEGGADAAE